MDLINIDKAFHLITIAYMCLSLVHGKFYTIGHILPHKTNLNYIPYLFWSQWIGARGQDSAEWWVNHRRNENGNKFPETNENDHTVH